MKLHQLRHVIAVADSGSLRSAARRLSIAQSAITKSVQQLEKELDVSLFERGKRGTALTPMGELFVQRARAATSELARAQDEIRQHRGVGAGQVAISLSTVPHMALLPSVIRPFVRRYPQVELTLHEALGFPTAEPLIRNGVVDAYVGIGPAKLSAEYQVEPLFRNQRCVIARAGHPMANTRSLRQLTDARWVLASSDAARANFSELFQKHRCKVPEQLTFSDSILSQVTLLLNSEMLMIGPVQLTEFAAYKGHLVRVSVREQIEAPTLVMVRRAASPLTPAAEHFCDLIRRASTQWHRGAR